MDTTIENLLCIIYISKSVEPQNDDMLTKILHTSREWNFEHGITGILLYNKCDFMQVLEGPSQEVDLMFEKIKLYKRHKEVLQIVGKKVKNRSFGKWAMAFRTVNSNFFEQVHIEAYNDLSNSRLLPDKPNADDSILTLIKLFIAINP